MGLNIDNKIVIKSSTENLIKFHKQYALDFLKLIPLPQKMDIDSKQGYEWRMKNWGTQCLPDGFGWEEQSDRYIYRFVTKNSLPIPIYQRVQKIIKGLDKNACVQFYNRAEDKDTMEEVVEQDFYLY